MTGSAGTAGWVIVSDTTSPLRSPTFCSAMALRPGWYSVVLDVGEAADRHRLLRVTIRSIVSGTGTT